MDGAEMVEAPAGRFRMGCASNSTARLLLRAVTLAWSRFGIEAGSDPGSVRELKVG